MKNKAIVGMYLIIFATIIVGCGGGGGGEDNSIVSNDGVLPDTNTPINTSISKGLAISCPDGCVFEVWPVSSDGKILAGWPTIYKKTIKKGGVFEEESIRPSTYRIKVFENKNLDSKKKLVTPPVFDFSLAEGELFKTSIKYERVTPFIFTMKITRNYNFNYRIRGEKTATSGDIIRIVTPSHLVDSVEFVTFKPHELRTPFFETIVFDVFKGGKMLCELKERNNLFPILLCNGKEYKYHNPL